MLDLWLPEASVSTRHRRAADASPGALWDAARTIRLQDTRRLGRLVGWRIPGVEGGLTYHELFRTYPFAVLEESEHRLVSGLWGKIWTFAPEYAHPDTPEALAARDQPGKVKVPFAPRGQP